MIMHTTDRHRAHATANCLLLLLITALFASIAFADEPRLVPFQARLTDASGADLTGVYRVTFVIYDAATGGTALWSEVHPSVSVIAGRLNVLLGNITSLDDNNGDGNTSDAVQFEQPRFVGIKVGGETNQEMVPRHQLVPSFYSHESKLLAVRHANGTVEGYGAEKVMVPVGLISPYFGNPTTLPTNWKLCDGSTVVDEESPLNGKQLPDLRGNFVRGEENASMDIPSGIITKGGHLSHNHTIIPGDAHSHRLGATNPGGQVSLSEAVRVGEEVTLRENLHDKVCAPSDMQVSCLRVGMNDYLQLWGWRHTHSLAGETGVADLLPPFISLHYIIRIK